jgi:hypothetical protein
MLDYLIGRTISICDLFYNFLMSFLYHGHCRLVDNINKSIGQDMESRAQIGVLDIYGFESFTYNRSDVYSFHASWHAKVHLCFIIIIKIFFLNKLGRLDIKPNINLRKPKQREREK